MTGTGAVYIAHGEDYVRMAARSAASLALHQPGFPALLFTDAKPTAEAGKCFAEVIVRPFSREGFIDKVTLIARSPFERTLYLDADTYVCGPLNDLFLLLDRFDIAAAHAPLRVTAPVPSVPDSFPELNAGVIAFRDGPEVHAFFTGWLAAYRRDLKRGVWRQSDQPSFRERIFFSRLRLAVLPPEWNCRFKSPGYAQGPVRLLHASTGTPEQIAETLNADMRQRVHSWEDGTLMVRPTARPAPVFE